MLQLPERPTLTKTSATLLNLTRRRKWLKFSAGGILLVIFGAMILGIFSSLQAGKNPLESPSIAQNSSSYGSYPATPAGANGAPAFAAAATVAAGATSSDSVKAAPPQALAPSKPAGNAYSSTAGGATAQAGGANDRMIIRNATLSLQAEEVEKFLSDVRALAAEQSGVVMQASTSSYNNKISAIITIQVPSQVFDTTISRIRKLAYKVDTENSTSQDVTEEFVDVDAQVRNLKSTEASYLDLLKKANGVNDILTIQRELNTVRSNIERLQGRMNFLQKKTDFSTINLNVSPKGNDVPVNTAEGWDAGKVFNQAWQGSLRGLQGLATILITLAVYSWWVLPLVLLGLYLSRRFWKRLIARPLPPPPAATQGVTS